jgi:uncharacterized protein (DUF2147 family)
MPHCADHTRRKTSPMFYRLSAFAIMAALCVSNAASAQTPPSASNDNPAGVWSNGDREIVIQITPCPRSTNTFCGTILQDNRPGPAANPANHVFIRDLRLDRQGWKGKINDGGFNLNLTMRLSGSNSAQARYCFALACETETWSRSNPPAGGATARGG